MKKNKGFTLIELLIVISIIGILTGLLTANLSSSQARGRDAKRKADLKSIATALEIYYNDVGNYPIPKQGNTSCTAGTLGFGASGSPCAFSDAASVNEYMKQLPVDPKNTNVSPNKFEYFYCTSTANALLASSNKRFNLFTNLENDKDPDRHCNKTANSWSACPIMNAACSVGSAGSTTFTTSDNDYTVSEP
ncbi:MAG: prepilin-type N-terminal cleavage/methylation domain-containing protein [bacterium]|nr:prepilin-type N-terminal cleavage/methylation domain-containing protein [bacterium]